MKQIMMLFLTFISFTIESCNLCWGYPGGTHFKRIPISKIECNCECWKYPHTAGDNNFYVCTQCEHRLTPEAVAPNKNKKEQKTYRMVRYENAQKKRIGHG